MPNFLIPLSLKCILLVAADRVVGKKPGMIGRAHRARELYGRVTEVHLALESKPVFADNHLDRIVTTPT